MPTSKNTITQKWATRLDAKGWDAALTPPLILGGYVYVASGQFIYKMEFHSVKVLRSHIENIPIPDVDADTQNIIIQTVEPLINGLPPTEAQITYEQLDQLIFKLFNLTSKEQDIIKHAVDGENKFLF